MDSEHPLEVPAFALTSRIHRPTLGKAISRTLRTELRSALGRAGVPAWAQERTETFVSKFYPIVRVPGLSKWRPKSDKDTKEADKGEWVVNSMWLKDDEKDGDRDPEEMSGEFQDFYESLREEARRRPRSIARLGAAVSRAAAPNALETSPSLSNTSGNGSSDEAEEKEIERDLSTDEKIQEMIDAVENTICSLFYDR